MNDKWISVKDRLPKPERLLNGVYCKKYAVLIEGKNGWEAANYLFHAGKDFWSIIGHRGNWKVKYWMLLPDPPKEKQ